MIVVSPKMQAVYQQARLCAKSDVDVLLLGESGTGKEVLARVIHEQSVRAARPFIPINSGSIPSTLIESEFFGHERGAFTDAKERRIGRFEQANGGTLFLDEVGELSPEAQVALLRVLETRQFTRVGGTQAITVDVRIIAATHRDLRQRVQENRFRDDLYWRLSVVPLVLPPLRERPEDILPLAEYFLQTLGDQGGSPRTLTAAARKKLAAYDYPGNVRELKNILWRAAVLCGGDRINAEAIVWANAQAEKFYSFREAVQKFGSVRVAARKLGVCRQTVYKILRPRVMPEER